MQDSNYYPCSSASLERVFMEIVRKSEEETEQEQNEQIAKQISTANTKEKKRQNAEASYDSYLSGSNTI